VGPNVASRLREECYGGEATLRARMIEVGNFGLPQH
jgi:hypothetical protein